MTTEQTNPDAAKRQRASRAGATVDAESGRDAPRPHQPISDEQLLVRLQGHLQFLGLSHTLRHLDDLLAWARRERPGATGLLDYVLGAEVASKHDARIDRRFRKSGLPERKTLEAFDWDFQPSVDKDLVLELGQLGFVERAEDVVITGQAGTGKSHILKAIGLRACQRGVSIRYARCVDLLNDLHASLADGTYARCLRAWTRPRLLIIDDVGLGQLKKRDDEPTAAHTLYSLIDRRHTRASTAITSNIELSDWGRYLGDVTITAAILDRLIMHAIHFKIDGLSYRQRVAQQRANQRKNPRSVPKKPKE